MTHVLCEPILDNGLRTTHFFNGRLLAAEDLHTQQVAEREHHRQLGRAFGGGVVRGLEVRMAVTNGSATGVRVSAGLAISAGGQPLELPIPVDLALVPAAAPAAQDGGFADCSTAPLMAGGVGVYALVMEPAAGFLQSAPKSGLGTNGAINGCGARYEVEGVAFRLISVDLPSLPGVAPATLADLEALMSRTNLVNIASAPPTDEADLSLLRNMLAHVGLGTEQLAGIPRDPFATLNGGQPAVEHYGLVDALSATDRWTDDAIALALVYWTRVGIRFVDMWSIRRRLASPGPSQPWDTLVGARRDREAEAALMQFQDQLAWLSSELRAMPRVVAQQWFRYLPAVCLVPLAATGLTTAVNPSTLLQGLTVRPLAPDPEFIEGATLRALVHSSIDYPPIDLTQPEMIRVYLVRENRVAIDTPTTSPPAAYLVLANGHMPVISLARFDLNYWNYANYA